jgi:hypothetical protein
LAADRLGVREGGEHKKEPKHENEWIVNAA